ncbi:hypothetical protein AWV80_02720 [Cupriavidus sp. UYMU48A]|nr:hypothetical protein AWV80_02720 [Cupriavidus sp. UYMU48A]
MSILDPRLWLAFLMALGLVGGAGYLKGRSDGKAVVLATEQKEVQAWRDNADAAYALYLEARDKKQIEYRTITKTVEVAKNATPDIPDCRTGDDWMRIYRDNAAVANGSAMPASAGDADRADAR